MFLRHRNLAIYLVIAVVASLFLWPRAPKWPSVHNRVDLEILNVTLGFQHIFVINLSTRTERRDAMTLSAALSELKITWVDGVAGKDVPDNALPGDPTTRQGAFGLGNKGSWRAHMNVLQRIVRENVTSALILEDDADWDVRLKLQMQAFAQAAMVFTQPSNKHTLAEKYRDKPHPEFLVTQLPLMTRARDTPYGDGWDVLWLGHCGTEFPATTEPYKPSPLRVIIPNDMTVPSPSHLRAHPFALQDNLAQEYPPYTRVVHASSGTTCTQAYAVSQRGARKLLWRFGLQTLTTGWDLMLRDWCDGLYTRPMDPSTNEDTWGSGRIKTPVCVTVQPPLFSHHYGKGAASDIMAPGGGFVNKETEMTPYVRISVRLNMERLISGEEAVEQWAEDTEHV
ncbi:glycosyltransferase family 25 protein [Parathielavia appendiculata]|uniref:Glycosyltransferase family 25 protein n=1 Tax=Parathielavia appendiculata TaxID=2587402 RepID=A0AAN6U6A6_9PEZI|nr:glycosyltransferase family 25 protein [Parathielavia appendiculata]